MPINNLYHTWNIRIRQLQPKVKKNTHPEFNLADHRNSPKPFGVPEPDCSEDAWWRKVAQFHTTFEQIGG